MLVCVWRHVAFYIIFLFRVVLYDVACGWGVHHPFYLNFLSRPGAMCKKQHGQINAKKVPKMMTPKTICCFYLDFCL